MGLVNIVDESNVNVADVDSKYKSLVTRTNSFKSLQDGDSYMASHSIDIALSASHYGVLVTPNTTNNFYLTLVINQEGESDFSIYEDITVSTSLSGTALSIYNKDRSSANTSSGLAYQGPTVTDVTLGSTIIHTQHFHSSEPKTIGPIKLDSNSKYGITFTNESTTAANYISYNYYWDEK
jgi:hypothetical protein